MYIIIEPGIARTNGEGAWWLETKPFEDWTDKEKDDYFRQWNEIDNVWKKKDPNSFEFDN